MTTCRIVWIGSILAFVASCGDSSADTAGTAGTGSTGRPDGTVGVSTTSGQPGSSGEAPTGGESGPTGTGGEDLGVTTLVDSGCDFLAFCQFDVGPSVIECDLFEQDCPQGQKCAPWASGGSGVYDGAHCVPVTGDGQRGDPCVATDSDEGLDDCARAGKCWDLDSEGHGVCLALCGGSWQEPTCAWDQGIATCITGEDMLALCRLTCDPLQTPCEDGLQCVPTADGFACAGIPGPLHQQDEPCESLLACAQGVVCVPAENAPPACGGVDCCEPYCLLPDGACPYPEQVCTQAYTDNASVGFCAVPSP